VTAVNDWAPSSGAASPPDTGSYGTWDASQPWGTAPKPGRSGARRAVIGVVAALMTLGVIMAGVIAFVLFVADPAGAAGGCGGG
jgi:hypothetical protein